APRAAFHALARETRQHRTGRRTSTLDAKLGLALHRPEPPARPHAEPALTLAFLDCAACYEIIEKRPRNQRLEFGPDEHIGLEPARPLLVCNPHGMRFIERHHIVSIGLESDDLLAAPTLRRHPDRHERRIIDRDSALLGRCHKVIFPVRIMT